MRTQLKKLDELGVVARGKSKHRPRNDPRLYNGEYPFIQTADVKNADLYLTEYSQTYNEEGLAQSALWNPGTLCITIAANIADTSILSIPACFPDSIIGFIPYEGISDARFVKYQFDLLQGRCRQISQGTAQDNMSWERLSQIDFYAPEYKKQVHIADYLEQYERLIENNRKQKKLLEEAAQRLYKEWFIDLKFPGHETTPIDPTTNLPEGWRKGVMSELITFVNGFAFKSEEFTQDGMLSIVTIKNVLDGRFDKNSMSKIDVEPRRMSAECVLKKGDILLSLTGNVGRTCLLTEDNCLLNQRVAKVISTVPAYAYCLLRSDGEKSRMISLSNGTAQLNLSPIRLGADSLLVPSHKVLNMFEDVLKKPLQLILSLNQSSGLLQEARDRLLPKLMSGEIEV